MRFLLRHYPFHYRIIVLLLTIFLVNSCDKRERKDPLLDIAHWKDEAINEILPPWTKYARDTVGGAFHSTLDADWKPVRDSIKFPSMIARNLFSYSVAYLLDGKQADLDIATDLKDYLFTYAWDQEYGGWYDALTRDGRPKEMDKSTFVQVYVITGLAMYYFVTHDPEVLDYVNRSNALLENNAWDKSLGGYYDAMNRDWSLKSEVKSFASQLAPLSGYVLYMYMATMDERYLRQGERITDAVLRNMVDPKTGWILELFDKNWKYLPPAKQDHEEINIGHNIEAAWSLARLHRLNKRQDYLTSAKALSDSIHQYGVKPENGFWYYSIGNDHPEQHSDFTYWWIQAYGNMFDLYMAGLYPGEDSYTDTFMKGAKFWNDHFVDRASGDTHFSVRYNGEVIDRQKANQFKAAYHSMEHCLLNFLYLGCWVNPQPFTLHFQISAAKAGEKFFFLPVEKLDAVIGEVRINNEAYAFERSKDGAVTLPSLSNTSVTVTFK